MKFKVNKNGEAKWHEIEAISGEDAIKSVFNCGVILYRQIFKGYDVFDNLDNDQLYYAKEIKNG